MKKIKEISVKFLKPSGLALIYIAPLIGLLQVSKQIEQNNTALKRSNEIANSVNLALLIKEEAKIEMANKSIATSSVFITKTMNSNASLLTSKFFFSHAPVVFKNRNFNFGFMEIISINREHS